MDLALNLNFEIKVDGWASSNWC